VSCEAYGMQRRAQRIVAPIVLFSTLLFLTGWLVSGSPGEQVGKEEIDYFVTVALGVEFGTSEATIKKWTRDLLIEVSGDPTVEDRKTLDQVMTELNALQDQVHLGPVEGLANVEIIFAPEAEFSRLEPNYQPTNYGFFWVNWDSEDEIYRARILISTDGVEQGERSHLIREELTQSLGLMRDSIKYPDSIFYANRSEVSEYAPIDETLIELLYSEAIVPGMAEAEVRAVLEGPN
jgi:hypothetical protein